MFYKKKKTVKSIVDEMVKLANSLEKFSRQEIIDSNQHLIFLNKDLSSGSGKEDGVRAIIASPEHVFKLLADTATSNMDFGKFLVAASAGAEGIKKELADYRKEISNAVFGANSKDSEDCDCAACRTNRMMEGMSGGKGISSMSEEEISKMIDGLLDDSDDNKK